MEYFSEINLRRAQKVVLAQYNSELLRIANSDLNDYFLARISDLQIENPIRDKMILIDSMEDPCSSMCAEAKNLLIEKYIESKFSRITPTQALQNYQKLTLLIEAPLGNIIAKRVLSSEKVNGSWLFKTLNGQFYIPSNHSAVYQAI